MPRILPRQRAPPQRMTAEPCADRGRASGVLSSGGRPLKCAQPQPSAVNPKFAVSRGQALSEFRIQSRTGNLKGSGVVSDLKFPNATATPNGNFKSTHQEPGNARY